MPYRSTFQHLFTTIYAPIACAVFVIVVAVLLFAIIHRRASSGRLPSRRSENTPLELGYAGVILGIAIFLIASSALAWGTEEAASAQPATLTVRVTGYQWCWHFVYVGTPVSVTADCEAGQFPVLMIPSGRNVRIDLESNDVVHELWIPHLRYKMMAFPEYVNRFDLRVSHPGHWRGLCDEFCGLYHDSMDFTLKAVTPSAFATWLRQQSAKGPPVSQPTAHLPVPTKRGGKP